MKNYLLLFIAVLSFTANAQITNRLFGLQNVDSGINPPNIMYTVPPNDNRIYQTSRNNLLLTTSQVTGLATYITDIGNINYKPLTYAPTFDEIVLGLGFTPSNFSGNYSDLNGKPNLFSGAYNDLTGKPNLFSGAYNDLTGKPTFSTVATSGNYTDLSNKPLLSLVATSGNYNDLSNKPTITTYTAGTGINIASGVISATATQVNLIAGNRISITGTYPNLTISYIDPTPNIVTRSLNTNFTPSTTKQSFVTYSVTCSVTNPLLAGTSTANVFLEYSVNAGSSWVLPSQNGNSSGVGLAVAVAITNGQTVTLWGSIPANALVRLRTTTTGTANVTYVTGQETY